MIIFSKILGDKGTVYDAIRSREDRDDMIRFSSDISPVVMWNLTKQCNLRCQHCYLDATVPSKHELSFDECKTVIDDLADMKIPMIIFTGGEPLIRKDFFEISNYVKEKGLKSVISTNGTLISLDMAKKLKEVGTRYVGVSLDSADPKIHDEFRGIKGSFNDALQGVENAKNVGIRTGVRITLTKNNYKEVPALLNLALEKGVERFCVYHLVPTGRGEAVYNLDLNNEERIEVLDFLYDKAIELKDREIEILTTDSPMDGVYILERLKKEDPERYEFAKELLSIGSGCTVGKKLANIDYKGNVYPCHFMPEVHVGNVREKPFSVIWNKEPCQELLEFRNYQGKLKGKCGKCNYKDLCGGCRKKAYFKYNDWMEEDPTCIIEI